MELINYEGGKAREKHFRATISYKEQTVFCSKLKDIYLSLFHPKLIYLKHISIRGDQFGFDFPLTFLGH